MGKPRKGERLAAKHRSDRGWEREGAALAGCVFLLFVLVVHCCITNHCHRGGLKQHVIVSVVGILGTAPQGPLLGVSQAEVQVSSVGLASHPKAQARPDLLLGPRDCRRHSVLWLLG